MDRFHSLLLADISSSSPVLLTFFFVSPFPDGRNEKRRALKEQHKFTNLFKKNKTHTQRCVCVCGENVNLKIRCKITSGTLQWQRRSFLAQKSRSLLAWSWYLVTFCHFVVFCGLCWPLHGSISTSKPFFPTQKKKCFYSRFLEIFHCVTEWRQVKGKRNSFISFPLIRWPRLKVSFIVCIGQQSDAVFGPPMASRAIQPPTCRQMKIRLTQMKLRFLKENIDFKEISYFHEILILINLNSNSFRFYLILKFN